MNGNTSPDYAKYLLLRRECKWERKRSTKASGVITVTSDPSDIKLYRWRLVSSPDWKDRLRNLLGASQSFTLTRLFGKWKDEGLVTWEDKRGWVGREFTLRVPSTIFPILWFVTHRSLQMTKRWYHRQISLAIRTNRYPPIRA